MAFASLENSGADAPLAEINMVPLIDVMLVLLVIFIVAAPLLPHAVGVDLPRASSAPAAATPARIDLAVDNAGRLFWNGEATPESELDARLREAAARDPKSELRLSADRRTPYETLARIMSTAARRGITRIGFVTLPEGAGKP